MAHGKRYRQQYDKVERDRAYPAAEAIALVKETASAKFDETVEVHVLLGVNVRHADEQLRGTLALPHGLGKDVSVAVFAQGQQARDAEAAGADYVGGDDLAKKVEEGWTDFDVAVATPDMMPTVGRLGRVLGPQGKMPNPKVGTVTEDIEKAVTEAKAGKVEYRTDRQAIVHLAIGKASFDAGQAARQLHDRDRGDHSRQAGFGEGQIRHLLHALDFDGTRHPGRHQQSRRPRVGRRRCRRDRSGARDRLDCVAASPRPSAGRRARKPGVGETMNREEKSATIQEIAAQIEESEAIFAVDYRGISVSQAAELRAKLRESDASFRIVKNRLTKLAADKAGEERLAELLQGPTALAFVRGDTAAAAKAISTFNKEHEVLTFKGGFMEGLVLDEGKFKSIAKLPSREVLYGQFAGIVASPITGVVRGLNALIQGLASQLGQIADQGPRVRRSSRCRSADRRG